MRTLDGHTVDTSKGMGEEDTQEEQINAFRDRIRPMIAELESIAGHLPPNELVDPFKLLHKHLLESVPSALSHLSPSRPSGPDWLSRFRSAVLDSLQEGVYAAHYHLACVERMESEMLGVAAKYASSLGLPARSALGVGHGNTRALTYEYQAYAFALRRTLEYLGVAIAAYFKSDCHSIKDLLKAIKNKDPKGRAKRVEQVYASRIGDLQDIVPSDKHNDRSVRDRLGHWEAVNAGTLNIVLTPSGFEIAIHAGGHELSPTVFQTEAARSIESATTKTLGPVLRNQFERVWAFIQALLAALDLYEAAA